MTDYEPTEADVQAAAKALHATVGSGGLWVRLPVGARLRYVGMAEAALTAVVPGIIARELRAAALSIGHHETCRQDPDRDPYIGCACRVSLLYGRADRIEAGAGESFCADCPDHEACSQCAPCGHVKRIAVARAKAEAWEEGAIWAVSQDWMQPQKRSDGTIVVSSRLTSEPQFGNPYREAGEQP